MSSTTLKHAILIVDQLAETGLTPAEQVTTLNLAIGAIIAANPLPPAGAAPAQEERPLRAKNLPRN